MNKIKILALTTDKGFGGAEKAFNELNNRFLENYEVHECFFSESKTVYKSECQEHFLRLTKSNFTFGGIERLVRRILLFRKLVKEVKPDIIISHLEGADYVSLLSFTDTKKICVIHGSKVFDKNIKGLKGFFRKKILIPFVYKLADKIVPVSNGIKKELELHYNLDHNKIVNINNALDSKNILLKMNEPIEIELEHIFKNKVLITCCRLSPEKNLCNMIEIFSKIKDENINLVIIGDGTEREKLIDYVKHKNLVYKSVWDNNLNENGEIYFLGYNSNPFKYYKQSNIYLLTSFNEGFPLSLIEAMVCKLPILSSNCPTGPDEILLGTQIINHKDVLNKTYAGVLLPIPNKNDINSIQLWVKTVKYVLNNNAILDSFINNSQNQLKKISPDFIDKKWNDLLKEMLS